MQLGDYVRQCLSKAETHGSISGWAEVESNGRPVHTLIPLLGLVVLRRASFVSEVSATLYERARKLPLQSIDQSLTAVANTVQYSRLLICSPFVLQLYSLRVSRQTQRAPSESVILLHHG